MRKSFKFAALLLSVSIMCSSCIGSFSLTRKLKGWNDSLGNKWVNELVFIGLGAIQVYSLAVFADVLVFNSMEFWTGNSIVANPGDTKIVKNSAGEDIKITTIENGYNLSNGNEEMQLVFDEAEKTWSMVYGEQQRELVKIIDDSNAQLFTLNGNTVDVTLDENGLDAARMLMQCEFALSK